MNMYCAYFYLFLFLFSFQSRFTQISNFAMYEEMDVKERREYVKYVNGIEIDDEERKCVLERPLSMDEFQEFTAFLYNAKHGRNLHFLRWHFQCALFVGIVGAQSLRKCVCAVL